MMMKKNNAKTSHNSKNPKKINDSEVDKRTSRTSPGSNTGARPPQEEDYDFEEDPQAEKINNEKKDEYQEKNKNR